ncbi:aminopeptidase P family protein [Novosphingobium profundi]|uniref:M24 family metallopeptidase n=1 Tax=Novosphingobium profundi TaxID=1774954 RepID=UPI001BD9AB88|nr:M24 family metallopeptidase [Novosphingobium profundi]MBT0668225.1 aminopeptidase P family protein [Novosphingobium profundi]
MTHASLAPATPGRLARWSDPELIRHLQAAAPLVNRPRAEAVMDKYGLDALVAALPSNIYYLSSHLGISAMMGRPYSSFAVLPRNPAAPASLVVNGSMVYHLDYCPTWMDNIETFTWPVPDPATGGMRAEPLPSPWAQVVREDSLTDRDRLLMAIYANFEGRNAASAGAALASAMGKAGLTRSRVGFDDMRTARILGSDFAGTPIDALNVFREVRMVKTEPEIAILREAARRNEAALDYAISRMHLGEPLEQVELDHRAKWGELEGKSLWLIVNQRGLNSGVVEKDEPTKLDSVGEYKGYKGDVGRTVVVGTPSDEVARRAEANSAALAAAYAEIRPGVPFAHADAVATDVLRQHGFARGLGSAHCVGLEHTDQPWPTGLEDPAEIAATLVYEEGTVFTLDMPYHEVGYGTSHVEDMMVVRKDGVEALSSMDTSLRVIPA